MEVKAHAKFLRLSPRKARYIVNTVKGLRALDAIAELQLHPQKASREVVKLLNSALANAQHNFGLSKNDLVIKEISADTGPTFKRYKPRAKGQADVIKRRMTHLSVVLESREGAKPKALIKEEEKTKEPKKETKAKPQKVLKVQKEKPQPQTEEEKRGEKVAKTEKPAPYKAAKEVPTDVGITRRVKKEKKEVPLQGIPTESVGKKKEKFHEVKKIKEETSKQKGKFAKKGSFFGNIKRFFRRKGF